MKYENRRIYHYGGPDITVSLDEPCEHCGAKIVRNLRSGAVYCYRCGLPYRDYDRYPASQHDYGYNYGYDDEDD